MTSRETVLAILLGGFLALGGGGLVGYIFVLSPLQDKWAQAEALRIENSDKGAELARVRRGAPRLAVAIRRSLPADTDVARQEYEAAITRLLREAKVPPAALTVTPRGGDPRSAPELPADPLKPNVKRYAYAPIRVEVQLKGVKFATLIDVLRRYYSLNLLHQITRFSVKKAEGEAPGGGYTLLADRPDLEVNFTTEAVSLYGAEARRSLLPVPVGFAALGGQASFVGLSQSPEASRGLTPLQLARVLAEGDRDYSLMLVRDIFHGPPPKPPVPPRPTVVVKDDTSAFIRLVGAGRNPDGTGTAIIEDIASAQQYAVDVTREAGKLQARVTKSYRTAAGVRKGYDPEPELDISESTSSTAVRFGVVGMADGGLVLTLKAGKPPRGTDAGPKSAGRVYHWRLGRALSEIEAVDGDERDRLVAATDARP